MEKVIIHGMLMEVGKSYKIYFGKGNLNNKKVHIEAILDNGEQIVYKHWLAGKQSWNWNVVDKYLFDLYIRNGSLRGLKK